MTEQYGVKEAIELLNAAQEDVEHVIYKTFDAIKETFEMDISARTDAIEKIQNETQEKFKSAIYFLNHTRACLEQLVDGPKPDVTRN